MERIRIGERIGIGVRIKVIGDSIAKGVQSGAINYMRWEAIPLLDGSGKE